MKTSKRVLIVAAVCAASSIYSGLTFAADDNYAAASAAKTTQTVLQRIDYPGHGYYTLITLTEMPPDAQAPLHEHPGIESGFIVHGGGVLSIKGQPDRTLQPGQTAVVPPMTPHSFRNGQEETEIVSTYVLQSGKPQKILLNNTSME